MPGLHIRRGGLFDLAAVICLTDVVNGIVAPTFALYARSLGGSLTLIGILAAAVGIARVAGAVPAGIFSDRFGSRAVLIAGICLFGLACALFAIGNPPELLLIPQALLGLAIVSTFPIGVAYIADRVEGQRRNVAISIYVSAQGIGYALGPLVGALVVDFLGYADTYLVAALLAGVTAVWAWTRLDRPPLTHAGAIRRSIRLREALSLLRTSSLFGVSAANLGVMLMFSASVTPFLALEAASLSLTHLQIGLLYSARAAASTVARIPAGLAARRLSNKTLLLLAIALDILAAVAIGFASSGAMLAAAALADGVAFGTFLSASQSYVAERFGRGSIGAALGAYSMAGSIGQMGGGFIMGAVAAAAGTHGVFRVSALMLAASLLVAVAAFRRATPNEVERPRADGEPVDQPARTSASASSFESEPSSSAS